MKKLAGIIIFLVVVLVITAGIVLYARGYRPNLENGSIEATGIVSIKSQPKGATVYVDGEEKGTTNLDLPDLAPGTYDVKIVKEGFSSWRRDVEVQKENLNLIDATLFPIAPSLRALTYTGVFNPIASPQMDKIAFALLEPEDKAGIWVLDISSSALPSFFTKDLTMVVADNEEVTFSSSNYEFSPDGKQLLVTVGKNKSFYLLYAGKENDYPEEV
ncbi:PEGA domain-containing protein, partial [Candidatus Pacearchaeota archaeon]|nr:PEGA domain-containing protein [Candidatus Pacearchaeota archaeon]